MAKSNRKIHLFAAICYIVCFAGNLIPDLSWIQYYSIYNIIPLIIWLALAITLFLNNRKAFIFSAGASALWQLFSAINWYFRLDYVFFFLAYACLVVLTVFSIRKQRIVKNTWYVPFILILIGNMYLWIKRGDFSYLSSSWLYILLGIIEVVAVALVGIWNKDYFITSKSEANGVSTIANIQLAGASQDSSKVGGADKIKMYKELLDSGVITQEEFDAKKKQILGL